MRGITVEIKRGIPSVPVGGLAGITIDYSAYAYAKVVNFKGVGVKGASVEFPDGRIYFADNKGNIALPYIANGATLIFRKDMARKNVVFNESKKNFTVNIEPPMPKFL